MRSLFLACLACLSVASVAQPVLADSYEFPKGFPYRAADVEWYAASREYSDGVTADIENDTHAPQTWNFRQNPWITGGLDDSDNFATFKFRVKPKAGPVTYWRHRSEFMSNENQPGLCKFRMTKGEIFGEVITTDGRTTEIGLLEITDGEPRFKVYRPFGHVDELKPWITNKWTWEKLALRNEHPVKIVDEKGFVLNVALTPEGVQKILARPFKEVTDQVFAETQDGEKCYAPTTTQAHGIVPRLSKRGLFTTKTCVACHNTAGVEGRLLDPHPHDVRFGDDLYGAIRGSHGVFSAPFFQWMRDGKVRRVAGPEAAPPASNMRIYQVK